MKGHFGVDSRSKLIHAVVATPANVADSKVLPDLLHGNESAVKNRARGSWQNAVSEVIDFAGNGSGGADLLRFEIPV